jgi:hypothetical protein
MRVRRMISAALAACASAGFAAAAADIHTVPCLIIEGVWNALTVIVPSLITLMFLFGAAKYAYSANDPGGRKQGKNICIHAMIGGILFLLTWAVMDLLEFGTTYPYC